MSEACRDIKGEGVTSMSGGNSMRITRYILFGLLSLFMLSGCGNFEWLPGIPVVLTITTKTLPDARIGSLYNQTLVANGGKSPYTWSVTSGTVPDGLTLSATGLISGTPTSISKTSTFTVTVTDSASTVATATQSLTITIPPLIGGTMQGNKLAFTNSSSTITVSTFAGSAGNNGWSNSDTGAKFDTPIGITTDGKNLYVADSVNNTIRKINISTGIVTTLAGNATVNPGSANGIGNAATFNSPSGITTDGINLYVADTGNNTIRQVEIASGLVSTIAGNPNIIGGSSDGVGTTATFDSPYGITTDGFNLYVADTNNDTIRQIAIDTKEVKTIAGSAGNPGAVNDTGSVASFDHPRGITTDGTNLYVADSYNNLIRKIVLATKLVTTLAGSGSPASTDGNGITAEFNSPCGITTDGTNIYIADSSNNNIRMIVIASKEVTTIAGSTSGTTGTADGTGTTALFNTPSSATTDGSSLFISDEFNHTIRRIQ